MKIILDLEAMDEGAAFFALYAGLRMYKEQRENRVEGEAISIAAACAFCMLADLEKQFPRQYVQAEEEYNSVYNDLIVIV